MYMSAGKLVTVLELDYPYPFPKPKGLIWMV